MIYLCMCVILWVGGEGGEKDKNKENWDGDGRLAPPFRKREELKEELFFLFKGKKKDTVMKWGPRARGNGGRDTSQSEAFSC